MRNPHSQHPHLIAFVGQQVTVASVTLLLIGPIGGLISLSN